MLAKVAIQEIEGVENLALPEFGCAKYGLG